MMHKGYVWRAEFSQPESGHAKTSLESPLPSLVLKIKLILSDAKRFVRRRIIDNVCSRRVQLLSVEIEPPEEEHSARPFCLILSAIGPCSVEAGRCMELSPSGAPRHLVEAPYNTTYPLGFTSFEHRDIAWLWSPSFVVSPMRLGSP